MAPIDFCYWLQGFAELSKEPPDQKQWDAIKEHLSTVFFKVTSDIRGWTDKGGIMPAKVETPKSDPNKDKDDQDFKKAFEEFQRKCRNNELPVPLDYKKPPFWSEDGFSLQSTIKSNLPLTTSVC
jgi:hypothetical protein